MLIRMTVGPIVVAGEHGAEAAGHVAEHAEPMAFGFVTPGMWVALSMTTLILIMVWKKVPGLITSGLDGSITQIRKQLDTVVSPKSKLTKQVKKPKATWVDPVFMAEIEYRDITSEGLLRQSSFKGLKRP